MQQARPSKAKNKYIFKRGKKKSGRDQIFASVKTTKIAIPRIATRGQQRLASSFLGDPAGPALAPL